MYHFIVVALCEIELVSLDCPFFDPAYVAHEFYQQAFQAVVHDHYAVSQNYFFNTAVLLLL
jgi:hypothetical protein